MTAITRLDKNFVEPAFVHLKHFIREKGEHSKTNAEPCVMVQNWSSAFRTSRRRDIETIEKIVDAVRSVLRIVPLSPSRREHGRVCGPRASGCDRRSRPQRKCPTLPLRRSSYRPAGPCCPTRRGEYEGLEARLTGGQTAHSDAHDSQMLGRKNGRGRSRSGVSPLAPTTSWCQSVGVEEKMPRAKMIGSIVHSSGRLLKSDTGSRIRSRGM